MTQRGTILVALKHLEVSDEALLEKAATLAFAFEARIELVHVLVPLVYSSGALYADACAAMQRDLCEAAMERLEVIAADLTSKGHGVTCAVEVGMPIHEVIARRATTHAACLVIAGCRPHHTLPRLLRYTDWELVRHCPCPLLLVKTGTPWRAPPVLAAVDPTHAFDKPASLDVQILRQADQLASRLGGFLHVVHACRLPPIAALPAMVAAPDVLAGLRERAEQDSRLALSRALRLAAVDAQVHFSIGFPTEAIAKVAAATRSQIIVMGAVSRSSLQRLLLGDTAEMTLDNLNADFLIVKPDTPPISIQPPAPTPETAKPSTTQA